MDMVILYCVQIAIFEKLSLEIISGLSLYLSTKSIFSFSSLKCLQPLEIWITCFIFSFWDDLKLIYNLLRAFVLLVHSYVWDTAFWNQNLKPDSLLSPTFLAGPGHQSIALCIAKSSETQLNLSAISSAISKHSLGKTVPDTRLTSVGLCLHLDPRFFPMILLVIDFFILRFAILLVLSTQLVLMIWSIMTRSRNSH